MGGGEPDAADKSEEGLRGKSGIAPFDNAGDCARVGVLEPEPEGEEEKGLGGGDCDCDCMMREGLYVCSENDDEGER